MPNRLQPTILNNGGLVYWRRYASLGIDEIRHVNKKPIIESPTIMGLHSSHIAQWFRTKTICIILQLSVTGFEYIFKVLATECIVKSLGESVTPREDQIYLIFEHNHEWVYFSTTCSLRWRHNERDGTRNHQPHDCLLNRLFRHKSKKTLI